MVTERQLRQFMRLRNRTTFDSNLQFSIDAEVCGFTNEDFRNGRQFYLDGFVGFEWVFQTTDAKMRRMIEFSRRIYLDGDTDNDTLGLIAAMPRAIFGVPKRINETEPGK